MKAYRGQNYPQHVPRECVLDFDTTAYRIHFVDCMDECMDMKTVNTTTCSNNPLMLEKLCREV